MALGRWGAQSMGPTATGVAARSRWLMAAMLAFHDESRVAEPTTWELRVNDGPFTVVADGTALSINAGSSPEPADAVVTTSDAMLHRLLTGQISPEQAIAAGELTVDGDVSLVSRLLALFAFPPLG